MNDIELRTYSDSNNEVYNINNNNNRNIIVNNSIFSDCDNRNINISDSETNNTATNNVVNSSFGEKRVNISNFLNNEYVNIYMTLYWLYNFLLGGRDANIIDLNYKKGWDVLFNNQIISGDCSKTSFFVWSAAFFIEIMPRVCTRQGLLFQRYKPKLTIRVNTENAVWRAIRGLCLWMRRP